jgi:chlorobactene glucosyltransferase
MMQVLLRWLKIAWHFSSLLLLPILTYRLWCNLRFLRWAREAAVPIIVAYPKVSVLVPARNEVDTISACVTSLMEQDYLNIEVIVLDDASTDGTGEKLDTLVQQYPKLKVIHANDNLPDGWNGKSYACQRLAECTTGDWLLFTDADTEHLRQSITLGVAQAQTLDVAMLSAFPYQITRSWSERILVSFIIDFLPLIGLDFAGIWRGSNDSTAANGQYLLMRRADYRALGGHAAIGHELVDDVALARHFQSRGRKIALVDGSAMLQCRMYHDVRQVWAGFSKNILLGLSTSSLTGRPRWLALPFAWGFACLFVTPFLLLFLDRNKCLVLLEIGWLALLRGITNEQLQRPRSEIPTTPLAAWGVLALGLRAIYRRWRSSKITWKGRLYRV